MDLWIFMTEVLADNYNLLVLTVRLFCLLAKKNPTSCRRTKVKK